MGYHPRIECKKVASFQTTRTRNSELWFVNNKPLEEAILGYAARYSSRYAVKLYALAIEGNHVQFPAHFPRANRAHFMRDFNSSIARAVPRYQTMYPGGRLFGRRYSAEYLPGMEDIEEQFFYTVLQPVQDELCDDISRHYVYNCFEDAISGTGRMFKVVRWKEYNDARRWNKKVSIEEYTDLHELKYARLPGYRTTPLAEYKKIMREKLAQRTKLLLLARGGRKAPTPEVLKKIKPGARPYKTKTSTIKDHRPRILSKDNERRAKGKKWYFSIFDKFKDSSAQYRAGKLGVKFPQGTYKPPIFTVARRGSIL